jgi:hypothetical protein
MMAMAGQSATQPAASKEEQVVQGGVGGLLGAGGALVSKLLPGAGASTQKGVSAEILNDIANANPKIRYPWRAAKALFGGMYEGADKAIAASPAAIKNMVELLRRGLVRAPADLYEENR